MIALCPGRFSTTTCWPRPLDISSATARATMSWLPPGTSGTMRWIGFDGNAWASAWALNSTARKSRSRTQRLRELAHIAHVFQAADERDDALHRIGAEMAGRRGAQFLFDLRARQRIGWIALRCGTPIAVRLAVRGA